MASDTGELEEQAGAILVVDDEEIVRSVTRSMLEASGFTVEEARDGEEAVALVSSRGEAVAAVLLDMTMPRMSGFEAFQHMRALRPDLPIVLSSGYSEQEATRRFPIDGLAGFLQKPYKPDDLVTALREAVRGRPPGAPGRSPPPAQP